MGASILRQVNSFGNLSGWFGCLRKDSESFAKLPGLVGGRGFGERDLLPHHALPASGGAASQSTNPAGSRLAGGFLDLPGAVWTVQLPVPTSLGGASATRAEAVVGGFRRRLKVARFLHESGSIFVSKWHKIAPNRRFQPRKIAENTCQFRMNRA